jgi:hypothetical protein
MSPHFEAWKKLNGFGRKTNSIQMRRKKTIGKVRLFAKAAKLEI